MRQEFDRDKPPCAPPDRNRVSLSACLRALAFIADLGGGAPCRPDPALAGDGDSVALELFADLIDLQQPWLRGHSLRVAQVACMAAGAIGLDAAAQRLSYRAALVHGLGRGVVSNAIWNDAGALPAAALEQARLAPYWTLRALREVGGLADAAEVASYAGERQDGSGHFRGCAAAAIPIEGQVLAASAAWVALRSDRPWRAALPDDAARALLRHEADAGRFNASVVAALCGARAAPRRAPRAPNQVGLSEREASILRAISLGLTNKEVARQLAISPSTVGTHVEKAFRKLGCGTRAAAVLRAQALRLI
jgi:HD-GYP domain-containing protein (c-di-GMP phosphodiesterase class II)/DNA-binding CsgD family transcriptional regulator